MRVFITGINGFVGPYLKRELEDHGHEVFGFGLRLIEDDQTFAGDITDAEAVQRALRRVSPDAIAHLAGFSSVRESWDHPVEVERVNAGGTKVLLEVLRALGRTPSILLVSSAEVYGVPERVPITETTPIKPVNPYGWSRVHQEDLAKTSTCPIIVSRSFPHTGPGQPSTFVVPSFVRQAVRVSFGLQAVIEVGNLDVVRDITDVRDVVRAYRLLMECGEPGETYNVCSGLGYRLRDLLAAIVRRLHLEGVTIQTAADHVRSTDAPIIIGDPQKIRSATGWRPEIPFLDKTLGDIVHYWHDVTAVDIGRMKTPKIQ